MLCVSSRMGEEVVNPHLDNYLAAAGTIRGTRPSPPHSSERMLICERVKRSVRVCVVLIPPSPPPPPTDTDTDKRGESVGDFTLSLALISLSLSLVASLFLLLARRPFGALLTGARLGLTLTPSFFSISL